MVTFNATPDAITMTEIVEQSKKDANIQGIVKMVTSNTSPEHIPNFLAEYRKVYHWIWHLALLLWLTYGQISKIATSLES